MKGLRSTMNFVVRKGRGLGLCSGGLDSTLAGLVLREQGVDVEWVTFETPFFSAVKAAKASRLTGIPLTVLPIFPEYLQMLRKPRAGYGKSMNPCMDCHALMFRIAGRVMRERGFDFLFSGEVLGQRPMSQTRPSLHYVEKHSGMAGYILRPLSAKLLPETSPEREGLVDRGRLLDLSGRGRKEQIALARRFALTDYPAPAGGCLLTDKGFSARLRDLFEHQPGFTEGDVNLLKFGRHLRLAPHAKLIVGRTERDNESILSLRSAARDTVLDVRDFPSPIGLLQGVVDEADIARAAAICVGYSKAPRGAPVGVVVNSAASERVIRVEAVSPEAVRSLMVPPS
jgi:tRNA U34 2-thiouridine synthase MnmA/TrmU